MLTKAGGLGGKERGREEQVAQVASGPAALGSLLAHRGAVASWSRRGDPLPGRLLWPFRWSLLMEFGSNCIHCAV